MLVAVPLKSDVAVLTDSDDIGRLETLLTAILTPSTLLRRVRVRTRGTSSAPSTTCDRLTSALLFNVNLLRWETVPLLYSMREAFAFTDIITTCLNGILHSVFKLLVRNLLIHATGRLNMGLRTHFVFMFAITIRWTLSTDMLPLRRNPLKVLQSDVIGLAVPTCTGEMTAFVLPTLITPAAETFILTLRTTPTTTRDRRACHGDVYSEVRTTQTAARHRLACRGDVYSNDRHA